MIPNELARETRLSSYAFQVAIVIRSHAEGYEVSIKSLADMLGWRRETVSKTMGDLVAARWVAIRKVRTANGGRAFEEYHLNASRKFTDTEAAAYNDTIKLPAGQTVTTATGHDDDTATPSSVRPSAPCRSYRHSYGDETVTKEDQVEEHLEEQLENQHHEPADHINRYCRPLKPNCWICEDT